MARRTGSERTAVTRGDLARDVPARSNGSGELPSVARAGVLGSRRRALPTGRAVVGGFLVAVAAVIVFGAALANHTGGTVQYAVAARTLAAGEVIGPGDLTTAGVSLPSGSRAAAFRQTATLIGRSVAVDIEPGELIESAMLVPLGTESGLRPVSLTVDPASLDDLVPGDSVDALATTTTNGSTQVAVVVRGASLIGDSPSSSSLGSLSGSGTLVTVGVGSLDQVEALVEAEHSGSITLILAEPSDGVGSGPTVTSSPPP